MHYLCAHTCAGSAEPSTAAKEVLPLLALAWATRCRAPLGRRATAAGAGLGTSRRTERLCIALSV